MAARDRSVNDRQPPTERRPHTRHGPALRALRATRTRKSKVMRIAGVTDRRTVFVPRSGRVGSYVTIVSAAAAGGG